MSPTRQLDAGVRRGHLNCPRCGLSIAVRPHRAAIRHCPRCVARSRMIVELFSSTLPADVLYDESSLPRVDDELALSSKTLAIANTRISRERRQRTQVADKFTRAQPLALVVKRPMAVPPPAIDARAASPRPRRRLATCPPCLPAGRAGRMAVPHRHQGMEVACALLIQRDRLSVTPRSRARTLIAVAVQPGSARDRCEPDVDPDSRSEAHVAAFIASIIQEGAPYAS